MGHYFVILFCICSVVVRAQTNLVTSNALDAYWDLPVIPSRTQTTSIAGRTNLSAALSSQNEVIANQAGEFNTAVLSIPSGSQNRLEVNQYTGLNSVDVSLSGGNNSILLNQTGTGNSISFGLSGNNNQYSISQDGGDRIQMQGLQKNNDHLDIVQGNGSNSLTIDNTSLFQGTGGIPNLRIEQSGGASVTIQQGKIIGN